MTVRASRDPIPAARIRRSLLRVLRENELCSIATVTHEGRPHINTAFFCFSDALEFFFLSDPGSLHSRNLAKDPSLAMAVFRSSQRWAAPGRGIQLFGRARVAKGEVAGRAHTLYARRFPSLRKRLAAPRGAELLRSYRFYRFLPVRAKIMDESEFGGAVFVIADIGRRSSRGGGPKDGAALRWRSTERLVP